MTRSRIPLPLAALGIASFLLPAVAGAQMELVSSGSTWKYLDDGSDQGTAWTSPAYDDSSWSSGAAELGYGDGDETTVVGFGPSASNKFVTTYFRHDFVVADASPFVSLQVDLQRDDGAVVYLNGTELFRSNMPEGPIDYQTLAPTFVADEAEDIFLPHFVPATALVTGNNTLAVEIHQQSVGSSDISFDLSLDGLQSAQVLLVSGGANWRYLDDGSDQGTAWRAPAFDDSAWAVGPAQLGYGDDDEATVVSFGPDPENKYITTYFRHDFNVADASVFIALQLFLIVDDGAVFYLNGNEILRANMPTGTINYLTLAASTVSDEAESIPFPVVLPVDDLVTGTNTLAVEVHQRSATSSDISFDSALFGVDFLQMVRGPYLQRGTPDEVTVRWRTNAMTNSEVRYGLAPGFLNQTVSSAAMNTNHELTLTGLTPSTTYYYSVGEIGNPMAGFDTDHFFVTPPPVGTRQPTRIWVLGDSGTASTNAAAVRDAYYDFTGSTHTDLWLMLGDNAYASGTDFEYQVAVFNMYPEMLRKSVLWPCRGNHETSSFTYQSIFTLPSVGEAGGMASGTEAYYSFDHANVHFIVLDSEGSDRSVGGPMWTWCQADIQATDQDWIIAYWHHPPYTKGSHDSDLEGKLIEMRENFLPMLEAGGIDLVLAGHSHAYERSYLIDGHYDVSATFTNAMKKDGGDGDPAGDGAYLKADAARAGTVYNVAGSSGQISGGSLDHPVMFHSVNQLGSVVLDIDGETLTSTFVRDTGAIGDTYTIVKGSEAGLTADVETVSIATGGTQTLTLTAGAAMAGELYLVLGSVSGVWPGFPIDGVTLNLNIDTYTQFSLDNANGPFFLTSFAFLDGGGSGTTGIVVPTGLSPSLAGTQLNYAYVVFDVPGLGQVTFGSNPHPLTLVP